MINKYFKPMPKTLEELKLMYSKLARQNHPDLGGETEAMQAVNNEYDTLFPIFKALYNVSAKTKNTETASGTRSEFYTQNGWKGENYNRNLSTKEITAKIREFVKSVFPDCKFSCTFETFSGGRAINISLMEAPKEVYNTTDKRITEEAYIQSAEWYLSPYFRGKATLTGYGKSIIETVNDYIKSYNYNDSDSQIDYFDTNFYSHFDIGKWNKPFKIVERNKTKRVSTKSLSKTTDIATA